jgi:hypothetical protein
MLLGIKENEHKDADLLVTGLSPSLVQDSADSPRSTHVTHLRTGCSGCDDRALSQILVCLLHH